MKKIRITLLAALILSACSYSLFINTYPHLKTIRIQPFVNRSTQYVIEQDLDDALSARFQKENLLKVVATDPDCSLEGEILDYTNKIYSYDTNNQVKEYEVKILFKIKVTDQVKNAVIFQDDRLIMSQVYRSANTSANGETSLPENEAEARSAIYEDLYDRIVKSTFQAW